MGVSRYKAKANIQSYFITRPCFPLQLLIQRRSLRSRHSLRGLRFNHLRENALFFYRKIRFHQELTIIKQIFLDFRQQHLIKFNILCLIHDNFWNNVLNSKFYKTFLLLWSNPKVKIFAFFTFETLVFNDFFCHFCGL